MKVTRNTTSYRGANLKYLEFTGGYGLWTSPAQQLFESQETPMFGTIEYGTTLSPLSFGIGAVMGNQFARDSIVLDPQYAFAFAKLKFSHFLTKMPKGLELYGLAGASGWQSTLDNIGSQQSEFSIPGGQKDRGIGMLVGAGVQYRFKEIGIGAQFHWITGKATYELANGDPVGALTGSKQVHVVLSYRMLWGRKKINCPIYSK